MSKSRQEEEGADDERTRRIYTKRFPARASAGLGGGIAGFVVADGTARDAVAAQPKARADRLPREVWIATISQNRMETDRFDQMTQAMLRRMEERARRQA
jgi:hypothetical protein